MGQHVGAWPLARYQMEIRDVFEFDRICIMGGEMDNFKRSAVITEIEMCSGYQMKTRDIPEFFQAGMKDATIEALNGVILVLRKTRMDNLGSLLEVDIKSASNEALASLFDTEDVSSTQCATVYSQSKTNAIAEKGLSISSKLLEVGRLAPLAIKAELPGTARKMSLIVMDLIKSTLETIYDRMKSNVDEAFIKAVMDEMKSKTGASPMGKK